MWSPLTAFVSKSGALLSDFTNTFFFDPVADDLMSSPFLSPAQMLVFGISPMPSSCPPFFLPFFLAGLSLHVFVNLLFTLFVAFALLVI